MLYFIIYWFISDINKHVLKEHSKAFLDIKNAAAARLEKVMDRNQTSLHYYVKVLNFLDNQNVAVITLKFKQRGHSIEKSVQKVQIELQTM